MIALNATTLQKKHERFMMKTLTIRNIDDELNKLLKKKAEESGTSLNSCIINILKEKSGLLKKQFSKKYSDLDELAGTWNKKDYDEFNENIASFDQIDEEMWK